MYHTFNFNNIKEKEKKIYYCKGFRIICFYLNYYLKINLWNCINFSGLLVNCYINLILTALKSINMTECSSYISAELAATCDALGYYDGDKYHLDKNCIGKYTIIFEFINM